MTKSLKKVLHRRHAGKLIATFSEGCLFNLDGTPSYAQRAQIVQAVLYVKEPPGLSAPSLVMDKLDRVSTVDFEDVASDFFKWEIFVSLVSPAFA